MKKSEYSNAVSEFELAMKRYKRAKLGADAMNYVNINMAFSYAKTGENKNISKAKKIFRSNNLKKQLRITDGHTIQQLHMHNRKC